MLAWNILGNFGVKNVLLKNLLLYSGGMVQINYMVMKTKEGSTKIVNFITPGAGVLKLERGLVSHILKVHYCLKVFFSTPWQRLNELSDQGRVYQIVNIMTRETGVLMLGRDHISHIHVVKMHFSFSNPLIYIQVIVNFII